MKKKRRTCRGTHAATQKTPRYHPEGNEGFLRPIWFLLVVNLS